MNNYSIQIKPKNIIEIQTVLLNTHQHHTEQYTKEYHISNIYHHFPSQTVLFEHVIFQQVKGKAPNLKVYVNAETAGRYICKVIEEGYPEIESEATIFIKSEYSTFL